MGLFRSRLVATQLEWWIFVRPSTVPGVGPTRPAVARSASRASGHPWKRLKACIAVQALPRDPMCDRPLMGVHPQDCSESKNPATNQMPVRLHGNSYLVFQRAVPGRLVASEMMVRSTGARVHS